jgi:hypothetical protein
MTEDLEPGAPLMGRMAFDIEKAHICLVTSGADTREALIAALAEVERLTMLLEELKKQLKFDRQSLDCYRSQNIDYTTEKAAQAKRIAELEGAAKADEGRLIAAAKKAGIEYFGCDTPDHLADRVAELEKALVEERARHINISSNIINLSAEDRWLTALDEARQQLRQEGLL